MDCYKLISEALQTQYVDFVIHKHHPRSGSLHYDLRFLDPKNPKLLHSFAAPSDFLKTLNKKSLLIKTRDHDPRWLTLKSYRLDVIDSGKAVVKIATNKYFEIKFEGKILSGTYKIFKLKTKRNDHWMMIRT